MTSRERIKATINHIEPEDRVAIDSGGATSGMHYVAYKNLCNHLGIDDEDPVIWDPVQMLVIPKDEVLSRLGVDTIYIEANPPSFWEFEPDTSIDWEYGWGDFTDEWGTFWKRSTYYADPAGYPLINADFEEVKKYKFPDPSDKARFKGLKEKAKKLYETTEKALVGNFYPTLFWPGWRLRSMEQWSMDILINKDIYDYLMDAFVDWNIAYLDCFLEEIGDYIEYTWIADDYGYQNGPCMNPAIYKETVVPRFKKQADFIKSKTNGKVKISNHSCGATYWMLEELVYIGVDIQNPMQANAAGNEDAARLKANFGDKITFHGNTDNQGVFHRTKDEVIADALYRIKHLAPGGGYIFSSGHNIQANMSPENMLALFDTAMEYGTYPINIKKIDKKISELRQESPAVENMFQIKEQKGYKI